MKEVKCEPNAVTYLGVISTLAVAGRAIEAIQMFEEMKSSGIDPTEQIFSVSTLKSMYFNEQTNILPYLTYRFY